MASHCDQRVVDLPSFPIQEGGVASLPSHAAVTCILSLRPWSFLMQNMQKSITRSERIWRWWTQTELVAHSNIRCHGFLLLLLSEQTAQISTTNPASKLVGGHAITWPTTTLQPSIAAHHWIVGTQGLGELIAISKDRAVNRFSFFSRDVPHIARHFRWPLHARRSRQSLQVSACFVILGQRTSSSKLSKRKLMLRRLQVLRMEGSSMNVLGSLPCNMAGVASDAAKLTWNTLFRHVASHQRHRGAFP
mmetsp:Transcript_44737/g.103471  ORF Transcript_44737/g.103471 Transcript_44737/m.103471 type:complete len:248 (+) Transcript_44737:160-903(+)